MFSGFLRKEREKQGISQERLCRGVCAVSALSRYEKWRENPGSSADECIDSEAWKIIRSADNHDFLSEYAYFEWKRQGERGAEK